MRLGAGQRPSSGEENNTIKATGCFRVGACGPAHLTPKGIALDPKEPFYKTEAPTWLNN